MEKFDKRHQDWRSEAAQIGPGLAQPKTHGLGLAIGPKPKAHGWPNRPNWYNRRPQLPIKQ